jgi:Secretion system C-terminal sorting domain/Carbohydrate binding domain
MKTTNFFSTLVVVVTFSFSTLNAQTTISSTHKGNIIHEGKAILPIGYWMEYNPIADKEKAVDVLGANGFDMITYGVGLSDKTRFNALFDKTKSYNMRVIYGLYGSGNILGEGLDSPAQDWVLSSSDGATIRDNSSLLGYYHSDDVYRFQPADLVAKNDLVKGKDPSRVTMISTSFSGYNPADYMEAADLVSDQIYPVTKAYFHGAYTGARRVVLAANAAGKSPAVCSQTHNIGLFSGDNTQRMPTPRELDVMTYLDMAAGMKSVWFYTYGFSGKTPANGLDSYQNDVWLKSIQIKNELRAWEKVFLFGKHFTETDIVAGSQNYTVFQGHWIYGNKVYVIAVNSWQNDIRGDRNKFISITLPEGTTGPVTSVNSNRPQTLSMTNNVLSGNVDYYGVQLYELPYTKPTVINGDFEGDFTDWSKSAEATVVANGGSKALKVGTTQETNSVQKDITHRILPNKTYTLSADTKSLNGDSNVMVFVQFRDYNGNNIKTEKIVATTANFVKKSVEFTAPDQFGTATVGVWRNNPSTAEVYVDNINIVEGGTNLSTKEELNFETENFTFYPNPTSGLVEIKNYKDVKSIALYNLLGAEVKTINSISTSSVDFTGAPEGTYVLTVTNKDGRKNNYKLIIKK